MPTQASSREEALRIVPFALQGTDGRTHRLDDIRGENGTLLMFICNHCPYVKTVIDRLVADVNAPATLASGRRRSCLTIR